MSSPMEPASHRCQNSWGEMINLRCAGEGGAVRDRPCMLPSRDSSAWAELVGELFISVHEVYEVRSTSAAVFDIPLPSPVSNRAIWEEILPWRA